MAVSLLTVWFNIGFSPGLRFNPEEIGNIFLRNVHWLSTDYTTLYPHDKTIYIMASCRERVNLPMHYDDNNKHII
jgi:hypothetical protein